MTAKGFWKRLPLLSAVLLQPAAAFATEGLPDTSLRGTGYVVLTNFPVPYPRDLTVDSSGRFLVSGLGGGAYIVARRLPDGSRDTTFGDAGATIADFTSLGYLADFGAMRHLPIPGGGYYAHLRISSAQNGDLRSGVVRMTATGALDVTFGSGGMQVEMPGFSAAAVDTDQRLAILGGPVSGAVYSAATPYVLRLTATGTRDPTFNGGNRLPITSLTTASDIARAPGGGYYVGGSIQMSAQPTQYIVGAIRLFADGTRDMDFGNGGVAYAQFGVGAAHSNLVTALTVQHDGKLLLAGISGSPSRCAVTRLLSDGQLDTGFGTGGNGCRRKRLRSDRGVFASRRQWAVASSPWATGRSRLLADRRLSSLACATTAAPTPASALTASRGHHRISQAGIIPGGSQPTASSGPTCLQSTVAAVPSCTG